MKEKKEKNLNEEDVLSIEKQKTKKELQSEVDNLSFWFEDTIVPLLGDFPTEIMFKLDASVWEGWDEKLSLTDRRLRLIRHLIEVVLYENDTPEELKKELTDKMGHLPRYLRDTYATFKY